MTTEIVLAAPETTAEATAIMTEGRYCSAIWAAVVGDEGAAVVVVIAAAVVALAAIYDDPRNDKL